MTVQAYSPAARRLGAQGQLLGVMLAQACVVVAALAVSGRTQPWAGWAVGVGAAAASTLLLSHAVRVFEVHRLGPADWVTLAREALVFAVAALVTDSLSRPAPTGLLVGCAAVALALDAVDGRVARRTGTARRLGAQLDGEVDAFLILVLSVYAFRRDGAWILAIGAMRYAMLAAMALRPWLRGPVRPRYWRKVVAAIQGITLTVAAAQVLPVAAERVGLGVALALLTESFGHDVVWLWRRRAEAPATPRRPPSRARRYLGVAVTTLAVAIVWIALVAPDQPRYFTAGAFVRIPIELLIVVLAASVLPRTPRRVLAVLAGVLLALLVVMKAVNYETYQNFDRPYDPIGDTTQFSNVLDTLRATLGRSETHWLEIGVLVGVIVTLVVMTLAMWRLASASATHRRPATRAALALGGVWLISFIFSAGFIAHTPVASSLTAGLFADEIHTVVGDLDDRSVFAAQIRHDPLAGTPPNQLLTALRGKDVILVFVEAYGQVAVQGSSFSPEVDATLTRDQSSLAGDGFSAQSGFLSSPTFGGISWLAHSTLESGLWVNTQDRYNQLLGTQRLTLASAFKQAGWRTVDDVPSNEKPWPQGTAFYGFDQIYDRHQVGYHGPTFTYASMPDEYTYSALNRLELAKPHRAPLFAEVDTVSSHEPWSRIPEQIPWDAVGNGSVFRTAPMVDETGDYLGNPAREQAAYGTSIVYSLNTLTQFVRQSHDKNLVLVVLGDHQPQPIVSGVQPNHDVPISIIAHDPSVLKRVSAWGWSDGLKPSPSAPVWAMSAFRDRFLTAFDAPKGPRR